MKEKATHPSAVGIAVLIPMLLLGSGCRTLVTREDYVMLPVARDEIANGDVALAPICEYRTRERWIPWVYLSAKSVPPVRIGMRATGGYSAESNTLVITKMMLQQGTNGLSLFPTNVPVRVELRNHVAEYTVTREHLEGINCRERFTLGMAGQIESDGATIDFAVQEDVKPIHLKQTSWFMHLMDYNF